MLAELLSGRLDKQQEALAHYRRHVELGGLWQEEAKKRIEEIERPTPPS